MESTRISRGAWRRSAVAAGAKARRLAAPAMPGGAGQAGEERAAPRDARLRVGRCLCGAVRFEAWGKPGLVELCHCLDCRKASGGSAAHLGTWPAGQVRLHGSLSNAWGRSFCPGCGSHVAHLSAHTVTILLGTLDEPAEDLVPEREIWTLRRQPWVAPVPGAMQFERGPV